MVEKVDPLSAALRPPHSRRTDDGARLRRSVSAQGGERFESRAGRRACDALRAVEWSEITARLNAARDLRLLMRSESKGQVEMVAASFGDAAASYFAMIDEHEPAINHDALDCSKGSDGKEYVGAFVQHDAVSGRDAGGVTSGHGGDARETQ